MAQDVAVLDFGSGKLTVLTGSRGANNTVQITSCAQSVYAGFQDGQWLKPELLTAAVSRAISEAESISNKKIKHLFIGVPGEFSACVVKSPSVSFGKKHRINEKDVEALMEQGGNFQEEGWTLINRQPVYYTLDDERRLIEPVGLVSKKLSGLVSYILAEDRFTNFVDSIMESIGVESAEYVSSVLAQSLFLLDEQRRDRITILIDIGYITSSVAVVRGDGLLSMNSFSAGGGHITGDLARYFGVSFADAETLKRKVMLSLVPDADDVYEIQGREFNAQIVNKMVSARVSIIAKAVQKCIQQCRYEIPQSASYCLTGGGISYMRGAKELLSSQIGHDVEIITPSLPQMNKPDTSSSLGLLNMTLEANVHTKQKKGFLKRLFSE